MVTAKNSRLKEYSILSVIFLSLFIFSCKDLVEPKTVPTVLTGEITNGTASSATVSGQIVDDGNAKVSERGVVIGKNADPTINDTKVVSGNGEGTFTVDLSGLTAATTYHVRAFGTNTVGTSYGLDKAFTTSATVPTIITSAVSEISYTSSKGGGNVTNDGGSAVTARGICWSLNQNPTVSNSKTSDGNGNGSFISALSQLEPNKKYYVRAYATNSVGTAYGEEVNFTTLAQTLPTLSTTAISEITISGSKSGGNITSDGGSAVTARGVCWSLNQNPTIADSKTTDGSGIGNFISVINQLSINKKYYVRAYATNAVGTAYGAELSFSTPLSPIPTNGLVGWWPFNGNANDESGNGNNGTVSGATLTTDRAGNNNKAYYFNGQSYIQIQSSSSLENIEAIDQFSLVISFNNQNPNSGAVFSLFNKYTPATDKGWEVFTAKNFIEFYLIDTPTIGYIPGNTCVPNLPTQKWVQLVFTYSKQSQTAKLYLDGNEVCTKAINVDIPSTNNGPLYFGYSPSGPDEYSTGILDDISMYNRVLTAEEILKIYNGTGF